MEYNLTQNFSRALSNWVMDKLSVAGWTGTTNIGRNQDGTATIYFKNKYDSQCNEIQCDMSVIPSQEDLMSGFETYEQNYVSPHEQNRASGNQKLLDLGLTQAEATALTGYTPPVEE